MGDNDQEASDDKKAQIENQEISEPLLEDSDKVNSGPDTGLSCLVTLLKFLGKAAEPEQIRHQRGKGSIPFDVEDILRACRQVEVKASTKKADWEKLVKMPLPAIGRDKQGQFFIIAKIASNDNDGTMQEALDRLCHVNFLNAQ